jgi:hypothetical protein
MPIGRDLVDRELAMLAGVLDAVRDPQLANLVAAIYMEDATDVVLSDEQIESGVLESWALDRLAEGQEQGG